MDAGDIATDCNVCSGQIDLHLFLQKERMNWWVSGRFGSVMRIVAPAKYFAFQVPAVSQSMQSQNSVSLPWVNLTPQPARMARDFLCCRFG